MISNVLAVLSLALQAGSATVPASAGEQCDVQHVEWQGELESMLSFRAVEILNRAARLPAGGEAVVEHTSTARLDLPIERRRLQSAAASTRPAQKHLNTLLN
jgi:hypothetical protein